MAMLNNQMVKKVNNSNLCQIIKEKLQDTKVI